MRQPGRGLDADSAALAGRGHTPSQGRLAFPGPHPALAAAPRRVDEHRIHAGKADVADICPDGPHVARDAVYLGVGLRHAQVEWVDINGEHRAMLGQGDQVAADPAAQVRHLPGTCVAASPVPGRGLRARLLQAGAREEHLPRPAELRVRLGPQLVLGQCIGHQISRILGAQGAAGPQRGGGCHRVGVQALQQVTSLRAQQRLEALQAPGRCCHLPLIAALSRSPPSRRVITSSTAPSYLPGARVQCGTGGESPLPPAEG